MYVVTLSVPEVIVLSGGVMKSSHFFMPMVEKALVEHNVMVPAIQVWILPAQLGYLAGCVGAAYAILHIVKEQFGINEIPLTLTIFMVGWWTIYPCQEQ